MYLYVYEAPFVSLLRTLMDTETHDSCIFTLCLRRLLVSATKK